MTEAYPLAWPEGWPRTPGHLRKFNWQLKKATFDRSMGQIIAEVRMLGGRDLVISTNQPLRRDGLPYAQTRRIDDPGVAVYFRRGKRSIAMARDAYWHIEQNLRSLALAIEHLRGLERHGGGTMMDRAFDGFAALPPPGANGAGADSAPRERDWWDVLGVAAEVDTIRGLPVAMRATLLDQAYRELARAAHPDQGGSDEAMTELNRARDQARKDLGL